MRDLFVFISGSLYILLALRISAALISADRLLYINCCGMVLKNTPEEVLIIRPDPVFRLVQTLCKTVPRIADCLMAWDVAVTDKRSDLRGDVLNILRK